MFGRLKNEAHVQPVAGCYSNAIHHNESRQTLQSIPVRDNSEVKQLLKTFWLYSCDVARTETPAVADSTKQQADRLLAATKQRALSYIARRDDHAAA